MKRRAFLATTATIPLAGCSLTPGGTEDSGGAFDDSDEPDDSPDADPTSPAETTPADRAVNDLSVTDVAFIPTEENRTSFAGATALVTNTSQVQLGAVTVLGKFYDSSDNLITTGRAGIRAFAPEETWEPWIRVPREANDTERVELVVSDAVPLSRDISPPGFVVTESTLQVPSAGQSGPLVAGQVSRTNDEGESYLLARPKVYAENGNLLGTGIKQVAEFAPGETWEFNIPVTLWNWGWKDRLTDHKVVLTQ